MPSTAPAEFPAPPESPGLGALWARWPGMAFRLDTSFRWTWIGESAETITGRSASSWMAESAALELAIHPLDHARFAAHRRSLPEKADGANIRFRLLHAKSGAVIWMQEFCLPEFDPAGSLLGFAGLWLDDTRAARLEQRLAAGAWNATLAAMAAGMAHDFNNVLTGVISVGELLLTQLPAGHPFRESLESLRDNGLNASRWIQRLSPLHQRGTGIATWHDANVLVADTLEILRHTLTRRYELSVECGGEPVPIVVGAVGFQRALLMLTFRAASRMKRPGSIRLKVMGHSARSDGSGARVSVGVESSADTAPQNEAEMPDPTLAAVAKIAAHFGGNLEIDQPTVGGLTTWLHLPNPDSATDVTKPAGVPAKRWVLLHGGASAEADSWADWLREQSYRVTLFASHEAELLSGDDYLWDAAVIVVDAAATGTTMKFLNWLRAARPGLPVFTVLPDEAGFTEETDLDRVTTLVPAGDQQRNRLLAKLAACRVGESP